MAKFSLKCKKCKSRNVTVLSTISGKWKTLKHDCRNCGNSWTLRMRK